MNFGLRQIFAASLFTVFCGAAAHAGVIDFEDISVPTNGVVIGTAQTSGGFLFSKTSTTSDDDIDIYNGSGFCSSGCWNNGTNILTVFDIVGSAPFEMVMTKVGGGAFNLISFDTAPLFDSIGDGTQNLNLTGTLAGGGTTTASLTYDAVAGGQLFSPMFSNVTSVAFSSDAFWPAIDNIKVSAVPLPAGFGFLLAGLGAFGLIRRQKTSSKAMG